MSKPIHPRFSELNAHLTVVLMGSREIGIFWEMKNKRATLLLSCGLIALLDGCARTYTIRDCQASSFDGAARPLHVSKDKSKILVTSLDGAVRLLDTSTGLDLIPRMCHARTDRNFGEPSAKFSKDESKILTRTAFGTARLFDAATGEPLTPPMQHEDRVLSATFSQDENKILTRSDDHTVRLFDVTSGHELIPTLRHKGDVKSAILSKDASKILISYRADSSNFDKVRLVDASTGRDLLYPIRSDIRINDAIFSHDESKIVMSSSNYQDRYGRVQVFDASTGKRLPPIIHLERNSIRNAVLSKDDAKILVSSYNRETGLVLNLVDASTGDDLISPVQSDSIGLDSGIAVFSDDDSKILIIPAFSGGRLTTTRLYDAVTGKELVPALRQMIDVASVMLSKKQDKVLVALAEGTVRLFDTTTGEELMPPLRHSGRISSASFSQDESSVVIVPSVAKDFKLTFQDISKIH